MNVGRFAVITTHVVVAGLLCLGSIVLVVSGSRSLPADALFDDSAQAVAAVDRAFDLGIAAFAVAYAAVVLLALRTWTRSGRWTLPFICDVGVVVPALLLVSPAGPEMGELTTAYLVLLACSAAIAGLVIVRDRPWDTWSGN